MTITRRDLWHFIFWGLPNAFSQKNACFRKVRTNNPQAGVVSPELGQVGRVSCLFADWCQRTDKPRLSGVWTSRISLLMLMSVRRGSPVSGTVGCSTAREAVRDSQWKPDFLWVSCKGHHCAPFSILSISLWDMSRHRPGIREPEHLLARFWNLDVTALQFLPTSLSDFVIFV